MPTLTGIRDLQTNVSFYNSFLPMYFAYSVLTLAVFVVV